MREIKFRAWTKDLDGVYRMSFSDKYEEDEIPTSAHQLMSYFFRNLNPNAELMQSTGIHDKNGKEIYEGDIIRYLNGEITSTPNGMEGDEFETNGVIFWDGEWAQWDVTNRIDVTREEVFTEISNCEIIGNIYEHPNLIP